MKKFILLSSLLCTILVSAVHGMEKDQRETVRKAWAFKSVVLQEKDETVNAQLLHACQEGSQNVELIKKLLENGADPNLTDEHECTSLHVICKNANPNIEVVKLLLANGASPNLIDKDEYTPLHLVCEHNTYDRDENAARDVVKLLLANGANPNIPDYEDHIPLGSESSRQNPNRDVVKLLLANGSFLESVGSTVLDIVCAGHIESDLAKLFLLYGASLKTIIYPYPDFRLIHFLCYENKTEDIDKFLEWKEAVIDEKLQLLKKDCLKAKMFLLCAKRFEIEKKCRIQGSLKERILIESVISELPGGEQMKEIFLSDNPSKQMCIKIQDELILFKDHNGRTAIEVAHEKGQQETVKKLMNFCCNNGLKQEDRQHLFEYFMKQKNKECIELLLENGPIDPNKKDQGAKSLICKAIDNQWLNVIVELFKRGAEDWTFWHYAYTNNKEILKELLSLNSNILKGLDCTGDGQKTILHRACEDGDADIVELLLKKLSYYHCNQQDASRATPLHRAVEKGNIKIVKLLLAKTTIDITVTNKDRETARDLVSKLVDEKVKAEIVNLFEEFEKKQNK